MYANGELNIRYDLHGQSVVEFNGLSIVLQEKELVTPVKGQIVEEGQEVKYRQASTVCESLNQREDKVCVQR